ncbi:uncharacterized protein KY384_005436 [Bacidia gigantensis]|uniref:uncharacterized protein n=1 Tax=Bacidia gigantensis TaxID=2732470 RepID=UPI001D03BD28|nr:uncharacterized protein KY384_005436 [Bacidia gigantensis]KAG8529955.1 hypothetical protein KY384_005436 [Bacidia gigantensis]
MSKSADSDRQIQEQNQHTRGRIAPKLPATRTPMPRSQVRQRVAVEATDRSVRGSPKPAFSSSRDSKHPTKRPGTLSDEKPKGKIETSTKFSSITDSPKSSAALRQTIAKAKAAHRTGSTFPNAPGAAFGNDSFPEVILSGNNSASLNKRIRSARMDGKLNIAAMGLKQLPAEILSMYDMNDDIADGSWAESVDLVKLIAADNEITYIEDSLLPVGKPETFANGEEDSQGLVLASLENLDMHGNLLRTLPHRMENLQCLTILNLSRNRIDNEDLKTIGRIRTLRELHVAENMVKGCVNHELYGLSRLESLDLSYNAITQISRGIARLSNLHTLKMAGNKITSLPADLVEVTALKDLDVSQNSLRGSLLPVSVKRSISLKIIDASFNALDSITGCENLKIPALQILKISQNRLTSLADVSCSPELTTLVADGNKLASIPEGFASLTKLRNADLSRNDIRHVDDHIGLMENLVVCSLANNPLRERRLLNMNTEDLKRELRSRHCQSSASNKENAGSGQNNDEKEGEQGELPSNIWSIQAGGVVDRSRSNIADIEATDLQGLAESGSVKTCLLHHNMLPIVPLVLDLLADTLVSLDISHNKLQGDKYLLEVLCLPKLRVLDLSANAIGSLEPLLSALTAPSLSELNVSRNRLVKLPELRSHFPLLTSIFAADNSISDLSFESVRGLQSLDVKSNEISFLEPKIGVLAYEGLRMFLVDANIFRVPRRDIVEKGSEAILTWLRSRIEDDA